MCGFEGGLSCHGEADAGANYGYGKNVEGAAEEGFPL
jgi:hypothetical protein